MARRKLKKAAKTPRAKSGKLKKALAIGAGVVGAGALTFGASRLLKRRGSGSQGKSTTSRLRSQVKRLHLRIEKTKLQRKLFKEQMKI